MVAFNLQQIITAFFHDGPGVLTLTVQGIGRDHFAVQSRQFFEQRGGRGLFAAWRAFLLVVNGHRLGRAILVLSQGKQANVVANHFTIQGQRLGQSARAALQPAVQERGEGFGIHPGEHLIEHTVTRNFMEGACAFLERQA